MRRVVMVKLHGGALVSAVREMGESEFFSKQMSIV